MYESGDEDGDEGGDEGGDEVRACARLGQRFEEAHLNGGVLLWVNALALVAVVVHARLPVSLREDGRTLTEGDEVTCAHQAQGEDS